MDSLNLKLSPIDDFNFNCSTHKNLYIGVCGNNFCKEKKLICMNCIKHNETCITTDHHELVSLSEFFYRFFLKQENKTIDLDHLNSTLELVSDVDRNEVLKGMKDFQNLTILTYNKYCESIKQKYNQQTIEILQTHRKNLTNLDGYKIDFNNKNIQDFIEDLKKILHSPVIELEKEEDLFQENILDFIKNKNNLSKKNINKTDIYDFMVKSNELKDVTNNIKSLIRYIKIEDIYKENNLENLEKKIDENLSVLEKAFEEQLEILEDKITIQKDNISYVKPSAIPKFTNLPENYIFKQDITESAHISNSIDSVFCAFRTLKGECLVAWGTPGHCLEIFDLKLNKIIKSIKNAHTSTIFSCRNYIDTLSSNDLLITSSYDKSVKVWSNKDNWANIISIPGASNGNYIYSVSILSDKVEKKNFIISSCPCEYMKVWDFTGKYLREFGTNTDSTYFVDTWYYNKNDTYYIINANSVDVKSYNFKTGLLYKTYKTTPSNWHMSAIVNQLPDLVQLIESDGSGTVRIWDFNTAALLKAIPLVLGHNLRGICLWNDKYLLGAGSDCNIKLFDLKAGTYLKEFKAHSKTACSIQKIVHPQFGECFITHALDGKLKMWVKPN